jgi:hypothetical protein
MIHLLILTHNVTGMKYLCKREGDWTNYCGSGPTWKLHLKRHGKDISRELVKSFDNKDEFREYSTELSIKLDVVNSNEWANKKLEEGDGGNTVGGLRCYNNDMVNAFYTEGSQPEGWVKGRWDTHNFSSEKQSNKSKKSTWRGSELNREQMRQLGLKNKGRPGFKGDLNPAKRDDVRAKISVKAKKKCVTPLGVFDSVSSAALCHGCCISNISSKIKRKVEGYSFC